MGEVRIEKTQEAKWEDTRSPVPRELRGAEYYLISTPDRIEANGKTYSGVSSLELNVPQSAIDRLRKQGELAYSKGKIEEEVERVQIQLMRWCDETFGAKSWEKLDEHDINNILNKIDDLGLKKTDFSDKFPQLKAKTRFLNLNYTSFSDLVRYIGKRMRNQIEFKRREAREAIEHIEPTYSSRD